MAVVNHANEWNTAGNVGLVVGATYPEQLADVRASAPELPILIPGVGAQEGDLAAAVHAGIDKNRSGALISASRAIIYASNGPDFQDAARTTAESLRLQIESARA